MVKERSGRMMELGRRKHHQHLQQQQLLKRKPLSDRTNLIILNNNKPPKTPPPYSSIAKPNKSKPSLSTTSSHADSCTGSNIPPPHPLPATTTTPPPQHRPIFKNPLPVNDDDCEHSKTATIYSRRQPVPKLKDKGKAVAVVPFSCPPPKRTKSIIWDERVEEQWDTYEDGKESSDDLSQSCPVSPKNEKKQQQQQRRFSMPALPQDFIEEQKKYFAEIDAFDLEEEVVSESELE